MGNKPDNWDEMDKAARKAWRMGRRKALGRMAERAVKAADEAGLAAGWDGEAKAKFAVARLVELIDAATPLPQPAEMIVDALLRGALAPLLETAVEHAFKRLRAAEDEA